MVQIFPAQLLNRPFVIRVEPDATARAVKYRLLRHRGDLDGYIRYLSTRLDGSALQDERIPISEGDDDDRQASLAGVGREAFEYVTAPLHGSAPRNFPTPKNGKTNSAQLGANRISVPRQQPLWGSDESNLTRFDQVRLVAKRVFGDPGNDTGGDIVEVVRAVRVARDDDLQPMS